MDITYAPKKLKEEARIYGVETITVFDEDQLVKRPLLKQGYFAFSIIDKENDFLFDFGEN